MLHLKTHTGLWQKLSTFSTAMELEGLSRVRKAFHQIGHTYEGIGDYDLLDVIGAPKARKKPKLFKARARESGDLVALKRLDVIKNPLGPTGVSPTALREISILRTLRHPCIVRLIDVEWAARAGSGGRVIDPFAVYEHMERDLRSYLDCDDSRHRLSPAMVRGAVRQIVSALNFCHSRGIIHRDVRPRHILIGPRGELKLAGFSGSRVAVVPIRALTHTAVTLWYRAPEILLGVRRYSMAIDVWSVGCVLWELARGEILWAGVRL